MEDRRVMLAELHKIKLELDAAAGQEVTLCNYCYFRFDVQVKA